MKEDGFWIVNSTKSARSQSGGARKKRNEWTKLHLYIQNGLCELCFKPIRIDVGDQHDLRASLDHIVPIVKGGKDTFNNTRVLHRRCDNIKQEADPELVCEILGYATEKELGYV